jgi:hypothetical protein
MFMKTLIKGKKASRQEKKGREPYVKGRAPYKDGKLRRLAILQ